MATEKMLNSFDIQDSIADDDIVLGYDKSENKVKNFKFGTGIWDWIVDKMANAVVSKLTTTDKTVLGAINELNSKASNLVFVEATHNIEGKSVNAVAQYIIDNQLPEDNSKFFFVSFAVGSRYKMIVQKYSIKDYASYILFGYAEGNISYHRKVAGKWI